MSSSDRRGTAPERTTIKYQNEYDQYYKPTYKGDSYTYGEDKKPYAQKKPDYAYAPKKKDVYQPAHYKSVKDPYK